MAANQWLQYVQSIHTQLTSLHPDRLLLVGIDQAVTILQAK